MAPDGNHIASGDTVRRSLKGLKGALQPAITHVDR